LGLCREAARQDSLNLKSGHRSSESSGRIFGKASTFAGCRILIEPRPFASSLLLIRPDKVRSLGIMTQCDRGPKMPPGQRSSPHSKVASPRIRYLERGIFMQGDDLSIFLFWATLAVTFGYEAVKGETIIRRAALGTLAGAFLLSGVFWLQIKKIWPPLTESVAAVATSPQSWFVLFIFISAILIFRRPPKHPNRASIFAATDGLVELRNQMHDEQRILSESADRMRAELEENVAKIKATAALDQQVSRDITLLLDFAVYQSTIQMLDDLLIAAPTEGIAGPLQLGGLFDHQNEDKMAFIDFVRRKLDPGSWRRQNFEGVMENAAAFAERELEDTPIEQRPTGIDPLALRKWAIIHRQCSSAISFLQHQRNEANENLLGQRYNLLRRYAELNK
jgi:hypothetical protein